MVGGILTWYVNLMFEGVGSEWLICIMMVHLWEDYRS